METTNSTSANDTYFESTKLVNQWYTDVAKTMADLYKKQLNLTTGFYSNLFGSVGGNNNIWNPMKNFSEMFNSDAMKKASSFNMSGMNSNIFNPFDKTIEQLNEYNQNLIKGFNKKMENGGTDFSAFNEKFQQTLEKEFDASRKLTSTLMESYNQRIENSMEINKDLQKEFNTQLNELFNMNKQLWADTTKVAKAQTEETAEKFSKNGNSHENEVKKNQKVNVHN
ncbi:MAG: hypothetical protein H7141_00185 [Burkholderiales bacterium]|nr:hypothetical protein [Bacteroidia bacterium]